MKPNYAGKVTILTSALVFIFILCLEVYWRSRGFTPAYNDDKIMWSRHRKKIYDSPDKTTVFIGGSRIKFDLDIQTWERLTGQNAIQLAIVGTPSRAVLRHLANDEKFKGNLVIDVAEGQFFTLVDSVRRDRLANDAMEYYRDETPAQRLSASINNFLEARLVFLEEGKFGLTALLNDFKTTNRIGVFVRQNFPKEFSMADDDRQTRLTPMFLASPSLQQIQRDIWMNSPVMKIPAIKGDTLDIFFLQIKNAIDRIRARGGDVVFVRPPSNEQYWAAEKRRFPRQKYWGRLLWVTDSRGIHFSDDSTTSKLHCPEWSHLAPEGAVQYTTSMVEFIRKETNWITPDISQSTIH
jgi:hypothetical protein